MLARISFCVSFFYFLTAAVSTLAESALTESTATTVESVLGASSAFLGVQDAKAIATTKNNNTFFISFKLLKFNMFVLQFKIDAKVHHFFIPH